MLSEAIGSQIFEYELHSLPNKNVSGAKDHGKDYIKVRPLLVRHLLRKRLIFTLFQMGSKAYTCLLLNVDQVWYGYWY